MVTLSAAHSMNLSKKSRLGSTSIVNAEFLPYRMSEISSFETLSYTIIFFAIFISECVEIICICSRKHEMAVISAQSN